MSDPDIGKGHETGGEILCRGDGPLHAVGVEVDIVDRGCGVLLEEAFVDHPFAEELSHDGFQHTSPGGQLTRCRGPLCPLVRREFTQFTAIGRQRGTDIMSTEDNDFLQLIFILELLAPLQLRHQDRRAKGEEEDQDRKEFSVHMLFV